MDPHPPHLCKTVGVSPRPRSLGLFPHGLNRDAILSPTSCGARQKREHYNTHHTALARPQQQPHPGSAPAHSQGPGPTIALTTLRIPPGSRQPAKPPMSCPPLGSHKPGCRHTWHLSPCRQQTFKTTRTNSQMFRICGGTPLILRRQRCTLILRKPSCDKLSAVILPDSTELPHFGP